MKLHSHSWVNSTTAELIVLEHTDIQLALHLLEIPCKKLPSCALCPILKNSSYCISLRTDRTWSWSQWFTRFPREKCLLDRTCAFMIWKIYTKLWQSEWMRGHRSNTDSAKKVMIKKQKIAWGARSRVKVWHNFNNWVDEAQSGWQ